ncbi:MAG: DUF357 domain-containing protein [Candidatus Aenigmatarchaeota archaeon]|nr:DUF357 domain-containing protein [Candidatus Aenigmarchaeota archaeon]
MKNNDKIENRDIEIKLKSEIEKWKNKIEEELNNLNKENQKENKKEILKDIRAYIEDSKYFYNKGDLIRAFEAIIWAWALFEISFKRSYSA